MKKFTVLVLFLGCLAVIFAHPLSNESQTFSNKPHPDSNGLQSLSSGAQPILNKEGISPANGNPNNAIIGDSLPLESFQRPQPRKEFEKKIFDLEDRSFSISTKEEALTLLQEINKLKPSEKEDLQLYIETKIDILVACSHFDEVKKKEYLSQAIACSQDLFKINPDQVHPYRIQANLFCMMGNHEKALDAYNLLFENVQTSPQRLDPMDYVTRANIYFIMNKSDKACVDIEKAEQMGFEGAKEFKTIFNCR